MSNTILYLIKICYNNQNQNLIMMHPIQQNTLYVIHSLIYIRQKRATIEQAIKHVAPNIPKKNYNRLFTILQGTCRFHNLYCYWLSQQCKLKEKDQDIRDLLATILFQCHHLDNVSTNQLIYHASEVCRILKKKSYRNLVHAILHKSLRTQGPLTAQIPLAKSIPDWLHKLAPQLPEQVLKLWLEAPKHAGVRINHKRISMQAYQHALTKAGIPFKTSPHTPYGLSILRRDIPSLPGLKEKDVYIQDIMQQTVTSYLPPLPKNARVLDACSAPGGKAGSLLNQHAEIDLTVMDKNATKISRLQENLHPLHANITYICADASDIESWWDNQTFDVILLDSPCSATGTLQAHPEIKLNQSIQNIEKLQETQQQLLKKLWKTLAPKGYLLYSTCSILHIENEENIQRFITTTSDATEHTIHKTTTLPTDEHQGFFVALLQKN